MDKDKYYEEILEKTIKPSTKDFKIDKKSLICKIRPIHRSMNLPENFMFTT
ncbi:hypothetical protein [Bacillus halotolerans]|uniref:hypothetical protein n=1 Tax=Bacillus halotolerans TaxID=260554 RepID=UPI000A8E3A28|nr:hypothetical protein [Bacillus halotolerans]